MFYVFLWGLTMATAGNLIAKESFSTSWAQTWSDQHGNKDQKRYVYICAPVWYIVARCWYYAFGGSGILQIYVSYWTGSAWSDETHKELNSSSSTSGVWWRAGHNREESGINAKFHSGYPLWRIRYWPSRNNSRWELNVYAGGWGVAKDTSGNYINYSQGKKVYSIGRTGSNVNIHSSGTTDDTTNVVNNIFNYSKRTGGPVLASCDSELVSYPYLA